MKRRTFDSPRALAEYEPHPYPAQLDTACVHKTPCSGKCILRADTRHQYHTCRDPLCVACHGSARFGRARV